MCRLTASSNRGRRRLITSAKHLATSVDVLDPRYRHPLRFRAKASVSGGCRSLRTYATPSVLSKPFAGWAEVRGSACRHVHRFPPQDDGLTSSRSRSPFARAHTASTNACVGFHRERGGHLLAEQVGEPGRGISESGDDGHRGLVGARHVPSPWRHGWRSASRRPTSRRSGGTIPRSR